MKKLYLLFLIAILSVSVFAAEATEEGAAESQPQSVSGMVESVKTFVAENGVQFLINLVSAAVIFLIGRWVARCVAGLIKKTMDKAKVDPTLSKFVKNLTYSSTCFRGDCGLGPVGCPNRLVHRNYRCGRFGCRFSPAGVFVQFCCGRVDDYFQAL
jgi:small-conductance mechanosensitive channel